MPVGFASVDPERLYEALAERKRAERKDEFETTEEFQRRVAKLREGPILGRIDKDSVIAFVVRNISVTYNADAQRLTVNVPLRSSDGPVTLKGVERARSSYMAQNAFGAAFEVTKIETDYYGLVINNTKDFAADKPTSVESMRGLLKENFSALTLNADAATAKQLKESLRALVVVRLASPLSESNTHNTAATFQSPTSRRDVYKNLHGTLLELWLYDSRAGSVLVKR